MIKKGASYEKIWSRAGTKILCWSVYLRSSRGEGDLSFVPTFSRGTKFAKRFYDYDIIHSYKYKKGFTLAEVLITLGIIGVVAALTIPTLIQNYKKREVETSLEKIYSTVNQAIKKAELDYGDYQTWEFGSVDSTIERYFIPYLNVIKVENGTCYNGNDSRLLFLADGSLLILIPRISVCNCIQFIYYPKASNWKGQWLMRACMSEDYSRSAFWYIFSPSKPTGFRLYLNSPFQPVIGADLKGTINAESLTDPKYGYACNKENSLATAMCCIDYV